MGHRRSIATGGAIYGLGWLVVAGGVHQHSLPLIYTGNALCGLGYGATYTPPLQVRFLPENGLPAKLPSQKILLKRIEEEGPSETPRSPTISQITILPLKHIIGTPWGFK